MAFLCSCQAATQRGKQGLHILDQQHWTDAEETNGDDVYRNAGSMWKLWTNESSDIKFKCLINV